MADIERSQIDIVVVYKDRPPDAQLGRLLQDGRSVRTPRVSFVSVTQQFNTTTSMGRLMLNVPLSFAQFEREVTGERIRDKIAASKRKGMWMGGVPPWATTSTTACWSSTKPRRRWCGASSRRC